MSAAVQALLQHPRPRAARGEPVPRALAAGRLAARVRRPGDRPGAGRGLPHRREGRPPHSLHAYFLLRRRSQGADHLRRRAHARRQELHHAAGEGDPARPADLHHVGVVPQRRGAASTIRRRCRMCRRRTSCRAKPKSASASCRMMPEPVRRYYERERPIELRPVEYERYLGKKIRGRPLQCLDPRHRPAAGRSGDPSMRARLCLRHDAARHRAGAAWPHAVREGLHGGEPRPRAVAAPAVPRRRLAALFAGQPQPAGRRAASRAG